jgi:hypothetical protein
MPSYLTYSDEAQAKVFEAVSHWPNLALLFITTVRLEKISAEELRKSVKKLGNLKSFYLSLGHQNGDFDKVGFLSLVNAIAENQSIEEVDIDTHWTYDLGTDKDVVNSKLSSKKKWKFGNSDPPERDF